MNLIKTLPFIVILAALSGCSSMKTTSDLRADYDFSNVDSYEWVPASDTILQQEDTYVSDHLLKELDKQLAARDWKRVYAPNAPDIRFTYYLKLAEHTEYTDAPGNRESRVTGGITFSRDTGNWTPNNQDPDLNAYTIETGTLLLNIRDAATEQLIWQGTLKTRIDRSVPIDKQVKKFREIARKISAQIPQGSR